MIVYKLYSLGFANYKTELLSLYIPYPLHLGQLAVLVLDLPVDEPDVPVVRDA